MTKKLDKPSNTITQRDVARLANASQAAVSRVVANNGYVASDVRQRIEDAAAKLGYRANPLARGLTKGQSNIIAVVMADIINPFYPVALDALTDAIQRTGREVLLFNAAHHQTVDDLIPSVLKYRVAGIIITTALLSSRAAEMCEAMNVPVVLMSRHAQQLGSFVVRCDNYLGATQAAEILVGAGCKRFAYIGGRPDSSTNTDRRVGFVTAVEQAGLGPVTVLEKIFEYDWGMQATAELFAKQPEIDAIFCGDDIIAFGTLDCLRHKLGKRVPQDVSVVGFDDVPAASWLAYDLTTIRQPLDDMVEKTLDFLTSPDRKKPAMHTIAGMLVQRSTVRKSLS